MRNLFILSHFSKNTEEGKKKKILEMGNEGKQNVEKESFYYTEQQPFNAFIVVESLG